MANGPYARVYQSIVDDPMFEKVYGNDHALAQWLRMLLIADAMYPTSAPMPPRNPTVRLLIACGLVVEKPGNRYSMRGLTAERERRSEIGRNAAAVRYQRSSTANPLPNRNEHNKTEQGANAQNGTFMGWPAKRGAHEGQHDNCLVCAPLRESEGTP